MIDPAYCADGCGRLAETERPTADGRTEAVCAECADTCGCLLGPIHTRADHRSCDQRVRSALRAMRGEPPMSGEHATPLEDR